MRPRVLRWEKRAGITLIEFVVVLAVVFVLLALVLPAIQQAREAARRTQCKSNLRQLGWSLLMYHDASKLFPPATTGANPIGYGVGGPNNSAYVALLPFIDSSPRYNAWVNSIPGRNGPANYYGTNPYAPNYAPCVAAPDDANYPPWQGKLPLWICPSDANGGAGGNNGIAGNTYRFSFGTLVEDNTGNSPAKSVNGVFGPIGFIFGIADITDGLNNTIMMSEHLSGGGGPLEVRVAVAWPGTSSGFTVSGPGSASTPENCMALAHNGIYYNRGTTVFQTTGYQWPNNQPFFTGCNTVINPNGPSCTSSQKGPGFGYFTPSSRHNDTVQVIMADASIRSVSSTVNNATWQALGTRNGNDEWSGISKRKLPSQSARVAMDRLFGHHHSLRRVVNAGARLHAVELGNA